MVTILLVLWGLAASGLAVWIGVHYTSLEDTADQLNDDFKTAVNRSDAWEKRARALEAKLRTATEAGAAPEREAKRAMRRRWRAVVAEAHRWKREAVARGWHRGQGGGRG